MSASTADQVRDLVALAIEKHGVRAASFAQHEALKARRDGDEATAETWEEIARLAEETFRHSPDP